MREASAALEAFLDETIRRSKKAGYHPTAFIVMRGRLGSLETVSRLVRSGEIQSGFRELRRLNLLDWSVEAAVVAFPGEFSKVDLDCARWRLDQAQGL
ncbi:hypothetical protein [Neomegalonema sp.]|uniref:hypothetical protein n=1 Tax=Neomegalonema sp. TaxID=2039713 RepID=UPI00260CC352|nr:hypothetical protein [Neomegalonema sp.]MDD2869581.1 hypothetical protein [Neomegalonema sp.]